MNGELKDFVLRKQDEHTKNLALFKTFERIRYFGKNVFIIGGIDDPDDSDLSGPIEKVIHVAILLACLLLIGGKYWIIKALIVYALIHYILQKLGKYFIDTYKEKLDEIAKECQERLNSFLFFVPPNENTRRRINPTSGIENRSSYPKYPHMEIG